MRKNYLVFCSVVYQMTSSKGGEPVSLGGTQAKARIQGDGKGRYAWGRSLSWRKMIPEIFSKVKVFRV